MLVARGASEVHSVRFLVGGVVSRIQHVLVVPKDPPKRGQLSIQHSPLEIAPWAETLLTDFVFGGAGCGEGALPDITHNDVQTIDITLCVLVAWDNLDLATLATLATGTLNAMSVVPNLFPQKLLGV